jgi:hypothetical protein
MISKIEEMYELYNVIGFDVLKCTGKTKAALNSLGN